MSKGRRLLLALLVVAVDAASKAWANRALSPTRVRWLVGHWMGMQLLHNPGATLGLGAGHPGIVTAVGLAGTAALTAVLLTQAKGGPGIALMLGGAAGNVLSRLTAGAVTDFLRVYPWPGIFNLADVALRVGAVVFLIELIWAPGARTNPA